VIVPIYYEGFWFLVCIDYESGSIILYDPSGLDMRDSFVTKMMSSLAMLVTLEADG
jgi:hypothetical protein